MKIAKLRQSPAKRCSLSEKKAHSWAWNRNKNIIFISVPHSRISFCPVAALYAYFTLRGHGPGLLFCEPDLSPITPRQFNSSLALPLTWASLRHLLITSHNFHSGAATHASAQGYSDSQIQRLGRWKPIAFKNYIRISSFNFLMVPALAHFKPSWETPLSSSVSHAILAYCPVGMVVSYVCVSWLPCFPDRSLAR